LGTSAAVCAGALAASAQVPPPFVNTPPYQLSAAIAPLPGAKITSFDISWVDPVRKKYYLANRTSKAIIVVDTTSNMVVGNFAPGFAGNTGNNNTSGPDGVLTTETVLWVGDAPSRVWALDPNNGAPIVAPIVTSTTSLNRADEGCYDPVNKVVAFVNNADDPPFITFISTVSYTVVSQIFFDGTGDVPKASNGAEQCQFNPRDQNIYLSLPEINGPGDNSKPGGVVVMSLSNPASPAILAVYTIPQASCTNPQGLAIGPAPQIGLGCNVSSTGETNNAIIQDSTGPDPGKVVKAFPGDGGCDMAWYNPGNNKYNVACRSANPGPEALFVIDAAGFGVQRLFTGHLSNGHSVASDPSTFAIYVPVSSASTSGLCSSNGAVDANGCILVYTPKSGNAVTATHDFNADSISDILWREENGGGVAMWLMKSPGLFNSAVGVGSLPVLQWTIVGQRDFNNDGNADILWRGSINNLAIWYMSGGTLLSSVGVGTLPAGWFVCGTGDFNGDGIGDILICDPVGDVAIWFMNANGTVKSVVMVGNLPPPWMVAGTGDFNGDGVRDILFFNTGSSAVAVWLMNNNGTIKTAQGVATLPPTWGIAGTGDFDGDGISDILLHATGGATGIWFMNGSGMVGSIAGVSMLPSGWMIAETGDFNGDGMSDLLLSNTGGGVGIWLMKGATITSALGVGSLPLNWQIQNANAD
jgi:hypothetical protein